MMSVVVALLLASCGSQKKCTPNLLCGGGALCTLPFLSNLTRIKYKIFTPDIVIKNFYGKKYYRSALRWHHIVLLLIKFTLIYIDKVSNRKWITLSTR